MTYLITATKQTQPDILCVNTQDGKQRETQQTIGWDNLGVCEHDGPHGG